MLINILSNALKYNEAAQPEILVQTKIVDNKVLVDIIDNGGGVAPEHSAMIFEKFARAHRADLAHGAGLGLPISRAIMRAMNGDLTAEFNDSDVSCFRLRLQQRG